MAPELYLITPAEADAPDFGSRLMAVLSASPAAAILVRRASLDERTYARLVADVVNIGQGAGAAVLVEDDVALAKRLGADGVHVTGGLEAAREAVSALKPDLIVGAGNIRSRHDAMSFGELGIDYLLFGPLGGDTDPKAAELASWWAETFEIPAVLSDPGATTLDAAGAEFLALSTSIWSAPAPADALKAVLAEAST
ncbi:thiamine phosphate synthase [Devosia albogilva]|uniref:Thiamine phosphate synthase n=1 Tax=Devosia albogilva TaxID=429726 RepID=A0ABW5QI53_9HYPH